MQPWKSCSSKVGWLRALKLLNLSSLSLRCLPVYVLFVLHYRQNPFRFLADFSAHGHARDSRPKTCGSELCQTLGSIPNSEVNAVCRAFFSLSRGNHSKGYELRNFLTFAKALIAGKVFVANHFKPKAGSLDVPGCNSKPDFFEVQSLMSCKCNWQLATRPNQETWHVEGYRSC